MIKTFENCSPEYQITIICFFIFLTLLYMILVIYEGTGKRQRKMLLLDSALLIVIFLITAVLCVWQRAFYEEDSMILFKMQFRRVWTICRAELFFLMGTECLN